MYCPAEHLSLSRDIKQRPKFIKATFKLEVVCYILPCKTDRIEEKVLMI